MIILTVCRLVLACHNSPIEDVKIVNYKKAQLSLTNPRDAMLARVIAIATCPSVRPFVCLSRAGIVSKRRKLAA